MPHTHDPADAVDDALEASAQGVRALKISLFVLLGTTVLQLLVVLVSGSVALLADTVHNFSDALTAVPLWVAFILGRRGASRRYTYGLGRAEDIAGLFIIIVVALSAIVAAWQSVDRIFNPQPITNLGWVIVAGLVGFAGNEAVAIYRIRVGRRIGSAALVADGVHARTDGFTSLAVVLGALGVLAGFPLADPIVGLLISAAIVVLLWGTVRSIGKRLLDGIEPELLGSAEHALEHVDGIRAHPTGSAPLGRPPPARRRGHRHRRPSAHAGRADHARGRAAGRRAPAQCGFVPRSRDDRRATPLDMQVATCLSVVAWEMSSGRSRIRRGDGSSTSSPFATGRRSSRSARA